MTEVLIIGGGNPAYTEGAPGCVLLGPDTEPADGVVADEAVISSAPHGYMELVIEGQPKHLLPTEC